MTLQVSLYKNAAAYHNLEWYVSIDKSRRIMSTNSAIVNGIRYVLLVVFCVAVCVNLR